MSNKYQKKEQKQREVKVKQGNEKIPNKPQTTPEGHDLFSAVFHLEGPGPVLGNLLDAKDSLNLARTSRDNKQVVYKEFTPEKQIQKEIGPDLDQLIGKGETAIEAYKRHKKIINRLREPKPLEQKHWMLSHSPKAETQAEMMDLIQDYPKYHWYAIITDKNFAFLFQNSTDLINFVHNYPDYAERIIEHIIHTPHLARLFYRTNHLQDFARLYPEYARPIITHLLQSPHAFAGVFSHVNTLQSLTATYPEYADAFIARVLGNDKIFSAMCLHIDTIGTLVGTFPNYRADIAERLLKPQIFNDKLIGSYEDLQDLINNFPEYGDELITLALSNAEYFANIFPGGTTKKIKTLTKFTADFPQHAIRVTQLFQEKTGVSLPENKRSVDNSPSASSSGSAYSSTPASSSTFFSSSSLSSASSPSITSASNSSVPTIASNQGQKKDDDKTDLTRDDTDTSTNKPGGD